MIGIVINQAIGIGDRAQFTHFPENIFKLTGEKVIDLSNDWVFDYNPYVVRDTTEIPSVIIDLWAVSHNFTNENFLSYADRFLIKYLGKDKIFCRGPRLYRFEDLKPIPNQVVVHLTGKSVKTPISIEIINQIQETYSNFEIIQIGGLNDRKTPFINRLGLGMWETIELIASSSVYIGINSSFMLAALAYPRISTKIIMNDVELNQFIPLGSKNNWTWLDHNVQYFNQTEDDIGVTHSYLKI